MLVDSGLLTDATPSMLSRLATACWIASSNSSTVSPVVSNTTVALVPASCGKSSARTSRASWESEPGMEKSLVVSPPQSEAETDAPTAASTHSARTTQW